MCACAVHEHAHASQRESCCSLFYIFYLLPSMAEMSGSTPPPPKKKRLSLSLKERRKERFAKVTMEEVEACKKKPSCKNTDKSQLWAFCVFQSWISNQGNSDNEIQYDESDLFVDDSERVCSMMCKFIIEARQRNGNPYCPKTLLQLATNLQSYALKENPNSCRFMDSKNPAYKPFHNALNNISKRLLSDGIGATKNQARVVTPDEENKLWEKGTIGTHSPNALLNAIFFYCGMYFCLRGGEEHRELKMSQLVFKDVADPSDSSKTIRCLEYTEHGSKNRKGLVHQVHLDNKIVRHYSDSSLGERCIVYLTELYCSKVPESAKAKDLFYCKPKTKYTAADNCWYFDIPIGRNILARKLNEMFEAASLDCDCICNHSLRATGISRLYNKGVPEKLIMERSGHLSVEGIRSYERTSEAQRKQVSKVLSDSSASSVSNKTDASVAVCSESNSVSKFVTSTLANKENVLEVKDLHGCTINFHFNS